MPDLTLLLKWLTVVGDRDVEARMSLYAPDAVWDMSVSEENVALRATAAETG